MGGVRGQGEKSGKLTMDQGVGYPMRDLGKVGRGLQRVMRRVGLLVAAMVEGCEGEESNNAAADHVNAKVLNAAKDENHLKHSKIGRSDEGSFSENTDSSGKLFARMKSRLLKSISFATATITGSEQVQDRRPDVGNMVFIEGKAIECCRYGKLTHRWILVTDQVLEIRKDRHSQAILRVPLNMIDDVRTWTPSEDHIISMEDSNDISDRLIYRISELWAIIKEFTRAMPFKSKRDLARSNLTFFFQRKSYTFTQNYFTRREDKNQHGSFMIFTFGSPLKSPCSYGFITPNKDIQDWWMNGIKKAILHSRNQPNPPILLRLRQIVHIWYLSDRFQLTVALVIFLNFISQAIETQLQPSNGGSISSLFNTLEMIFVGFFCFELVVNMFSTLWLTFLMNAWNWFDMLVIGTSLWSIFGDGGGGTAVLRLLRAGRVIRFFNRLPSLRKIIVALYESIPAMLNAMLLTATVIAMYGIMGVSFFSVRSPEWFGSFSTSMFTLFQASTFDGWSDIVRTLYQEQAGYVSEPAITTYFISFMLIVALILFQVVIAVLLEEFSKVSDAPTDEKIDALFSLRTNPFEAFYETLGRCRDDTEFEKKADMMYELVAGTQGLGPDARLDFDGLKNGLQNLKVHPPAIISQQDWQRFVERMHLCDEDGTIGRKQFKTILKAALQAHQVEKLLKIMDTATGQWNGENMREVVFALKSVMLRIDETISAPPVTSEVSVARNGEAKRCLAVNLDSHLIENGYTCHENFVEGEDRDIRSSGNHNSSVLTLRIGSEGLASNPHQKEEDEAVHSTATALSLHPAGDEIFQIQGGQDRSRPCSPQKQPRVRVTEPSPDADSLADKEDLYPIT
eukprot:360423-Hanusia_phi.AAC.4